MYIKDIPNSEVRRILNSVGRVYFKQNMKVLSHKLSEKIKDRFNYILKGKSKNEILELLQRGNVKFWLTQFIVNKLLTEKFLQTIFSKIPVKFL